MLLLSYGTCQVYSRLLDIRCSLKIGSDLTIFDDFFLGIPYSNHILELSGVERDFISFTYKNDEITTTYSDYCKSITDYNELNLGTSFIGLYLTTTSIVNKTAKFKCIKAPNIIE